MPNAPFDQLRSGRGLVVATACDANDLAPTSAGAGHHRRAPRSHKSFRPGTAVLAQGFGYDRHWRPGSRARLPRSRPATPVLFIKGWSLNGLGGPLAGRAGRHRARLERVAAGERPGPGRALYRDFPSTESFGLKANNRTIAGRRIRRTGPKQGVAGCIRQGRVLRVNRVRKTSRTAVGGNRLTP
jgi:hypothetical protein